MWGNAAQFAVIACLFWCRVGIIVVGTGRRHQKLGSRLSFFLFDAFVVLNLTVIAIAIILITADVIHTHLTMHHPRALLRRHISSNASDVVESALVSPNRDDIWVARRDNLSELLTVFVNGLRTAVVIWLEAIAAWHPWAVVALRFVDKVGPLFTQRLDLVASFALLGCLGGDISVYWDVRPLYLEHFLPWELPADDAGWLLNLVWARRLYARKWNLVFHVRNQVRSLAWSHSRRLRFWL